MAIPDAQNSALIDDLWFPLLRVADGVLDLGLTDPADPFATELSQGVIAAVRLDGSRSTVPRQIASADPHWTALRIVRVGLHLPHSVPLIGSIAL